MSEGRQAIRTHQNIIYNVYDHIEMIYDITDVKVLLERNSNEQTLETNI